MKRESDMRGIDLSHRGVPESPPALEAANASHTSLTALTDHMPQMVWSTRPDGYHDYYNAQWYAFTGVAEGSTDGEGWAGMFHPEDQPRAWARWRHSLATGDPYEVEYRLRHRSGQYRWVLGRALPIRDGSGRITRWIGTCTDIDAAKRTEEELALITRELSHRIKNIFSVVSGLIQLSVRQFPSARAFADDLARRLSALARAHDFARPHSEQSRVDQTGAGTLGGLLATILSPYPALDEGRITTEGPEIAITPRLLTPLSLLFHELATNAAKYGALSVATGRIRIGWHTAGDDLVLDWVETGGAPLAGPPAATGFGSRLADLSVTRQLRGRIVHDWRPEGLAVRLAVPRDRFADQ